VKQSSKNISIIDKGEMVDGTLACQGRLVINGTVKGNLKGDNIIVSQDGVVQANTEVNNMTLGGAFEGEIRVAQELIILSTGNCSGKIFCKNIVMEAGGMLNASVTHIESEQTHTRSFKNLLKSPKK
jgi:cytoskeletal protein CcmA (bactofilin family)